MSDRIVLQPLHGVPLVNAGDDIAALILTALRTSNQELQHGDVLVLAQKIVSKAEGRSVDLNQVTPSARASELAALTGKDARLVELILSESRDVLRALPGIIIVEHRLGIILANAGIDRSNVGGSETALLLPLDSDASSRAIRQTILERTGIRVGLLIIDSIGRAWRNGTIGTAIGASGVPTLLDLRGKADLYGRRLETTELGWADEVAAAASLIMGQAGEGRPIVLVRGLAETVGDGSARDLLRPVDKDLFR
jgi:coenzyme F420-0:L-glutamate ligase / coenzyme F420-1:gamma-L-glutamate ligase